MNKKRAHISVALVCLLVLMSACRHPEEIIPEEIIPVLPQSQTAIAGFYLLNEGNMNANKASLDYYDYETGVYHRGKYDQANPESVKGLGDVGNDLGIYGSKMYAVINGSHKVEIMNVSTAKRLNVIEVKNGRYVRFANGKAYVSSYDSEVQVGTGAAKGTILEIDTTTLEIVRRVTVGRQPEEMAIIANKLYVANSGGYSPTNYERTVSVIDLETFEKIKDIDVAVNLHRIKADAYGDLYVSSRGDYTETNPPSLYVIDTRTTEVKKSFPINTSNFTIAGDTAYIIGADYDTFTNTYYMINVKSEELLTGSFISEELRGRIQFASGIAVDPFTRIKYLTDVMDYATPGRLYGVDKQGELIEWNDPEGNKKQFIITTGDIPAHIAFVYK